MDERDGSSFSLADQQTVCSFWVLVSEAGEVPCYLPEDSKERILRPFYCFVSPCISICPVTRFSSGLIKRIEGHGMRTESVPLPSYFLLGLLLPNNNGRSSKTRKKEGKAVIHRQ
mmetsp:Transcript_53326/g.104324  ORF Transcript_53326/g.104324 Transcript_53326/m.104324 type:complete len:115 (+) Transcript_53326:584-928(+)